MWLVDRYWNIFCIKLLSGVIKLWEKNSIDRSLKIPDYLVQRNIFKYIHGPIHLLENFCVCGRILNAKKSFFLDLRKVLVALVWIPAFIHFSRRLF